ncbi:MAG: glycosyltransferase family 1 protein [Candidatus Tectomicrobia bacterium]|nr:glycosyltransferase family 1 protein [Candidatus Tectomicrobia bacterium]
MVILVAGYIVRYPLGGMIWSSLQYLLGFQQLGHEVYFMEDSGWPLSCYNPEQNIMTSDPTYGVNVLSQLMKQYNLDGRWVYVDSEKNYHGLSQKRTLELTKAADLLINVSGSCWLPEFASCRKKVFIDTDPGFTQFGTVGLNIEDYDVHMTYGYNIGRSECPIPTMGFDWKKTRPPVALGFWPPMIDSNSTRFTTIMHWSAYETVTYEGEVYGQKDLELVKFLDLPGLIEQPLELAVGIQEPHRSMLEEHGWGIIDPLSITKDIESYQTYIHQSRAEFSVAKNGYVKTRSGWFSERSTCYLASGKPVLLQDTGFSDWLPTGRGLLTFHTMEEATAGIEEINAHYLEHCRTARAIAEEYFDSKVVLSSLLEEAGL